MDESALSSLNHHHCPKGRTRINLVPGSCPPSLGGDPLNLISDPPPELWYFMLLGLFHQYPGCVEFTRLIIFGGWFESVSRQDTPPCIWLIVFLDLVICINSLRFSLPFLFAFENWLISEFLQKQLNCQNFIHMSFLEGF